MRPGADLKDCFVGIPGAREAGERRGGLPAASRTSLARSLGMRTLAETFGGSSAQNVNRSPTCFQPVLIGRGPTGEAAGPAQRPAGVRPEQ